MSPFATRTDLFARSFLEPLGKLALSMLQQFLLDDQTITVTDFSGQEVPVVVTSEEIQTGRYRVVATLTRQDSTRLAKAQSIERVLPTLAGSSRSSQVKVCKSPFPRSSSAISIFSAWTVFTGR